VARPWPLPVRFGLLPKCIRNDPPIGVRADCTDAEVAESYDSKNCAVGRTPRSPHSSSPKSTGFTCVGSETKLNGRPAWNPWRRWRTLGSLDLDHDLDHGNKGTGNISRPSKSLTSLNRISDQKFDRLGGASSSSKAALCRAAPIKSHCLRPETSTPDPGRGRVVYSRRVGRAFHTSRGVALWVNEGRPISPTGPLRVTEFNIGSSTYLVNDDDIETCSCPLTATHELHFGNRQTFHRCWAGRS